ncbi:hypothetical protein B481_0471 [Planococcus halocryophilus Or1]|uniref:hypothetical protein n=1 Tax=Planococcus halocryophilus TaxID=1215089 RepID=UPI0002B8772A|nr:hypothetical protein [Planococcus halocryophilus]EMF47928.1 hypothetical protein B481_0471 [Planococcus halocryophilus Or1]
MVKIEGDWQGAINVPGQTLPVKVTFMEQTATISIPVQGITNYPLTNVRFDDPFLYFEMNIQNQKLIFDGSLQEEMIDGTFTQQGQVYPFELKRPGVREEVTGTKAEISVQGGTMSALIVKPEGEGPFPVMLILSGSGPTDKNGNSPLLEGDNNSLQMIAENLATKGIATIRYDKRGVGDNAALAMQLRGSVTQSRKKSFLQLV